MALTLLLLNWSLFAFSLSSLAWLLISGRLLPHTVFKRIHLDGIPLNTRDIILVVGTFIQITVDAFLLGWRIESGENFWSSFARESATVAAWVYALVLFFLALIHKLDRATALLQLQCFYALTLTLVLVRLNSAVHELYIGEAALSLEFFLDALFSTINSVVLFWATITMPQEPGLEAEASDLPSGNPVSPETTASVYSAVTFSWMTTLIYLGNRRTLEARDLPELLVENRSNTVWHGFLRINKSHTFLQCLILYNLFDIIWQFIAAFGFTFFEFSSPYFLGLFLTYVQDPTTATRDQAYLYILLMFLSQLLRTIIQSQMFFLGRRIDVRLKSILNAEIYAKALRRRNAADVSSPTANSKGTTSKNRLTSTLAAEGQDKPDASAPASHAGTGKITNLMSVDAGRVANCANYSYLAITSPLGIIIGSVMLYHWLGWSFLIGLVTAVAIQPLSARLTAWYSEVQKKLLQARDERIALTNELLQSIRMIKFFAWERPFSERILFAREFELDKLFSVYVFSTFLTLVYQSTPLLITLISFIAFTKFAHGELTAPIAFTSIVLFDKLRWPLMAVPTVITAFVNGAISLRRIEDFLSEPEIDSASPTGGAHNAEAIIVGFKNATLKWYGGGPSSPSTLVTARVNSPATDHQFYLRNVDVSFPVGEFSIVCGPTGSGKTALLMALLGEMELVAGQIFLPRSVDGRRTINLDTGLVTDQVAFVAEQAWLQNATIRENVLFGQPMNRGRYEEVLRVCALERDLEVWEDGDLTEIGEKGITLSGGQKQRIALARAVYSHAQNLILDDCFAAVDAHTAKHIYRECIKGDLVRGRTVILVTHHVRLCLSGAAYLVKLEYGRVVVAGETAQLPESLLHSVMDIEDELVQMTGGDAPSVAVPWDENPARDESVNEDPTDNASTRPLSRPLLNRVPTITLQPASPVQEVSDALGRKQPRKLVEEERREQGRVRWTIYQFYTDVAGTPAYWALLIVVFLVSRFFNVAEGWWLKIWSTAYDVEGGDGNLTMAAPSYDVVGAQSMYRILGVEVLGGQRVNVNYYLGIYTLISLASIAFPVVRVGYAYVGSFKAARVLHQRLLEGVVRAPLRFYDTVPVGRILNRFSKDLEMIDSQLMSNFGELLSSTLAAISIVIVVSVATPPFLITAIFIGLLYWHVGQLYNNSSRELKRLDSASKSPIFSQFGETMIGVTTIRAFGEQSRFMSEMLLRTDDGLRAYYAFRAANRWLAIRADFIGALIALLAGLLILLFPNNVDAGLAGLSLTYALNFVYQMNFLVREYTNMELNLTSVERVHEYVEMPQEPPGIIANSRPPVWWPHDGRIEVRDLVVQYAPQLETVIRGISFDIKAKERVGIVGRTGSGKSTLALSLFRFVDPTKGAILIDGIDIASIGLEDLRSRLTIIPQDPILLSGNVRSNLDPFNEYTEDEIWESLRRVQLVDLDANEADQRPVEREDADVISLITSLDDPVSEGGRNFSQGQRQLLCLARALLRNSKIIVMDEATASVDLATDRRIQATIRQEFKQSTLLCIAHRLRTVIDYDRVLVLDQGQILEYDTPYNLLFNDEDTVFRKMCEASGEMDALVEAVTLHRLGGGR